MKKITCSALGGPCDHVIEAETKEELMTKAMDHVKAAHPEMVADIEKMTPEEKEAWANEKWAAAPEEAEETEKEVVLM